jgi:hypothetical protein
VKKAAAIARKDALIAVISRPIVCLLVAEREELFLIEGLTHRGKVSFYCGNRSFAPLASALHARRRRLTRLAPKPSI